MPIHKMVLALVAVTVAAGASAAQAASHAYCDGYAKTAIQQYLEAKKRNLPNTDPPVWSPDYYLHYNWCLGTSEDDVDRGTWERAKVLNAGKPLPAAPKAGTTLVPGLVLGLRHTYCKGFGKRLFGCATAGSCQFGNNDDMYNPTVTQSQRLDYRCGGDIGAKLEFGFTWNTVKNGTPFTVPYDQLPPGIVIGLWHSGNEQPKNAMVAGTLAADGYSTPIGLVRVSGGDRGAPANVGYRWFETTGQNFNGDWSIADRLPKYTVIGLTHSLNMKGHKIFWKGIGYSAACATCSPPPDFVRVSGGDLGAPSGHGFMWFEKVSGPEPGELH
jgi:hypothetical protein